MSELLDISDEIVSLSLSEIEETVDVNEILYKIIEVFAKHNLTFKCLEDILRLIKNMPVVNSLADLPSTKYGVMKQLFDYTNTSFFIKCDTCNRYTKAEFIESAAVCVGCNTTLRAIEMNFFVHIKIKNQLISSIEQHFTEIFNYNKVIAERYEQNNSAYQDIWDGSILKKAVHKIKFGVPYSLVINTNGAATHQSKNNSLWGIQVVQNNLPPEIRYKTSNIILTGLFYGRQKPNVEEFFHPIVEELRELETEGILITNGGKTYKIVPVVTHCSVDLQAKCLMQNMVQFNGSNACSYCLHPGVPITNINNNSTYIRYIAQNGEFEYRNHRDMIEHMVNYSEATTSDYGLKGTSCMVAFRHFDLVFGFCGEYMHAVLLGTHNSKNNVELMV